MSASSSRIGELLAPAGCFASLQAAIDGGADAIYYGLSQLNMRARARRSFDGADQPEIVSRCHDAGVKATLALNTLLYEHDLPLAKQLLCEAKEQGVDAVILADMAAIEMARELDLEVHISTQLSVSNYASFRFYSQYSDRIVLARELGLPLIKRLYQRILDDDLRGPSGRLMEIEAFAHGAMCIAVSGRCGMSLYTSNASANRGACEQNCRKAYEVRDVETGQALVIDNDYVMSPEDICTIEFLDQMFEAGVRVFKLEGRGRPPEYVHTVTRCYRRALDAIVKQDYSDELVASLKQELSSVYNRGLGTGYYLGRKQSWSRSNGTKATHIKIQIGRVQHYYDRPQVAVVQGMGGALRRGDRFVVVGQTTGVVEGEVQQMRLEEEEVEEIKGKSLFTLKVPSKVRINDMLYVMRPVDARRQA